MLFRLRKLLDERDEASIRIISPGSGVDASREIELTISLVLDQDFVKVGDTRITAPCRYVFRTSPLKSTARSVFVRFVTCPREIVANIHVSTPMIARRRSKQFTVSQISPATDRLSARFLRRGVPPPPPRLQRQALRVRPLGAVRAPSSASTSESPQSPTPSVMLVR